MHDRALKLYKCFVTEHKMSPLKYCQMITAAHHRLSFRLLHLFHNPPHLIGSSVLLLTHSSLCVQAAGGGGGCGEAVSPESVSEESVQGAQCQLQPDDTVL